MLQEKEYMQALERRQAIIVLDYGSQYSRLITRRVRECHVYSELVPASTTLAQLQRNTHLDIKGFILSGGPSSVYDENAPSCDPAILASGLPILGICYGMHLLAHQLGGHVQLTGDRREYGPATLEVSPEILSQPVIARIFEGITDMPAQTEHLSQSSHALRLPVWMSHGDSVDRLPDGFQVLASSESNPVTAMANERGLIGLQFHPEVTHTPQGKEIIRNFLYSICGCSPSWTSTSVIDEAIASIRQQVGSERLICALSGGVDSAVAALLVHRAVGDQLTCIFVDNGCMRAGDREQVIETFIKTLHIPLRAVDAGERFLARLEGVSDPEEKRKIIGEEFIRIFEEEAEKLSTDAPINFLVQGTLYPDVIESTSHDTAVTATRIKTHHNVGGLPQEMTLKLVEPLRAQRLDQLESHFLRQAADVVVSFDPRGCNGSVVAGALDHVGVERALDEEIDGGVCGQLLGLFFKDADELFADDLAFLFGIADAFQASQKAFASIDRAQRNVQGLVEGLNHLLTFACAHTAIIDKNTRELVAHRSMDQQCGYGRIDAARKRADEPFGANLLANRSYGLVDDRGRGPGGRAAADGVEKIANDLFALGRVRDFGMELQANQAALIGHSGHRVAFAAGQNLKAIRQTVNAIAVTHPHRQAQGMRRLARMFGLRGRGGDSLKDTRDHRLAQDLRAYFESGRAVFAPVAGKLHVPAKLMRQQMHAIANTQDGQPAGQNCGIAGWRVLVVDAGGAARKDEAFDIQVSIPLKLCESRAGRNQFAVDMALAHAAGDQPAVLRTVVENNNRLPALQGLHILFLL